MHRLWPVRGSMPLDVFFDRAVDCLGHIQPLGLSNAIQQREQSRVDPQTHLGIAASLFGHREHSSGSVSHLPEICNYVQEPSCNVPARDDNVPARPVGLSKPIFATVGTCKGDAL